MFLKSVRKNFHTLFVFAFMRDLQYTLMKFCASNQHLMSVIRLGSGAASPQAIWPRWDRRPARTLPAGKRGISLTRLCAARPLLFNKQNGSPPPRHSPITFYCLPARLMRKFVKIPSLREIRELIKQGQIGFASSVIFFLSKLHCLKTVRDPH